MKSLYEQEFNWAIKTFAFNPLWPTIHTIFNATKSHFMFFHDIFKNVFRLGHGNIVMENWAKDRCYQVSLSQIFKRELLFSLIVDSNIMLETNRMLGDIGVCYNKSAHFGNFMREMYEEIIEATGERIVRENLIQATGNFNTLVSLGSMRIKKNKATKNCMKNILKNYLIQISGKKAYKQQPTSLTKGEWLQCCLLVTTCVENDVLTSDKLKKFAPQLINAYD